MRPLFVIGAILISTSAVHADCQDCNGRCNLGHRIQLNHGPVRSVIRAAPVRKAGAAVVVGAAKVGKVVVVGTARVAKAAVVVPARAARRTACSFREHRPLRRTLAAPFRVVGRWRFSPQRCW